MNKIAFYICFHLIPYNLSLLSFPCVFYFIFNLGAGGGVLSPRYALFFYFYGKQILLKNLTWLQI